MEFEWDEVKNQINQKKHGISFEEAREEYDIKSLNPRKNPYLDSAKHQVTISLDDNVVEFFKRKSVDAGIPYQILINLYLRDCALNNRHIDAAI